MYRDRHEPYVHWDPPEILGTFWSSPPSLWTQDEQACAIYASIYGEKALDKAVKRGLVCENTDPVWVGGTNWQGKVWDELGNIVHALPAPVPQPNPPGPLGTHTTPLTGFADVMTKLAILDGKLDKLLAR